MTAKNVQKYLNVSSATAYRILAKANVAKKGKNYQISKTDLLVLKAERQRKKMHKNPTTKYLVAKYVKNGHLDLDAIERRLEVFTPQGKRYTINEIMAAYPHIPESYFYYWAQHNSVQKLNNRYFFTLPQLNQALLDRQSAKRREINRKTTETTPCYHGFVDLESKTNYPPAWALIGLAIGICGFATLGIIFAIINLL